jgi:hypothetical protein
VPHAGDLTLGRIDTRSTAAATPLEAMHRPRHNPTTSPHRNHAVTLPTTTSAPPVTGTNPMITKLLYQLLELPMDQSLTHTNARELKHTGAQAHINGTQTHKHKVSGDERRGRIDDLYLGLFHCFTWLSPYR